MSAISPSRRLMLLLLASTCCATALNCSVSPKQERSLAAVRAAVRPPDPAPLQENLFQGDRAGSLAEEDLQRVLAAPVFLEERSRLGVVRVTDRYGIDPQLPIAGVPAILTERLERTGLFEVTTEISADWPAERGISGLRELAARYRAEYLLLYRHRFAQQTYTNGWGWLYLTLVGTLFVPGETLQAAGVLEATLFDVKTGTLLFTVLERVEGQAGANLWHHSRKQAQLQQRLLAQAADKLADGAIGKLRTLVAARPALPPLAAEQALVQP